MKREVAERFGKWRNVPESSETTLDGSDKMFIHHTYYIPKAKIIDFMPSPNYLQILNRFRDTK